MADNTVTTTNIQGFAPVVAPYAESVLGQAAKLVGRDYKSYADWAREHNLEGDQVAKFTKLQTDAFKGAERLGQDPYSQAAAQGLQGLAQRAGAFNYAPTQFGNQFQAPSAYQPGEFDYQRVSSESQKAPAMEAAQTGYNPQLQNYQMGPAERVSTQSFAQPGSAQAYMSPYMQSVVDIQKREAARQAGIQGTQQQAQAAQAGAFGGGRDAIMRAERERNLAQQLGDIQATGSQAAYQQAQQQFNAEQQARLAAQQANQQAGLTVGQQNLAANLGIQQLGTQTGLQTALANLSNQQQAAVQNQAAQLQMQGMSAQQALQAALANQQAGITTQQQQEQAKQFGYGQGMQAASLGAQYGLAAQQEAERSKQFGANLGLQGLQAGMQGYGALGSQGQNLYGQTTGNLQLQNALGTQQQQQGQNLLDVSQQNYAAEQNYPYKQVGWMSDIVRGAPVSSQGSTITQPAPSIISQAAGLGGAALGASKLFGKAKGGQIKQRGAGLADLAMYQMSRG
jgi:hypothetical protein